ncbi:MAG TPA: hypothetical protein VIT65_28685 [Microlunatus sp.]
MYPRLRQSFLILRNLVVKSNTGQLFRVDPRTGKARLVDPGGYALTNGDG